MSKLLVIGFSFGYLALLFGLAITKKIVELHRGHLWVESEVEQGAAFFVELPLVAAESPLPSGHDEFVEPHVEPAETSRSET